MEGIKEGAGIVHISFMRVEKWGEAMKRSLELSSRFMTSRTRIRKFLFEYSAFAFPGSKARLTAISMVLVVVSFYGAARGELFSFHFLLLPRLATLRNDRKSSRNSVIRVSCCTLELVISGIAHLPSFFSLSLCWVRRRTGKKSLSVSFFLVYASPVESTSIGRPITRLEGHRRKILKIVRDVLLFHCLRFRIRKKRKIWIKHRKVVSWATQELGWKFNIELN